MHIISTTNGRESVTSVKIVNFSVHIIGKDLFCIYLYLRRVTWHNNK
jgi:hypothetical protein